MFLNKFVKGSSKSLEATLDLLKRLTELFTLLYPNTAYLLNFFFHKKPFKLFSFKETNFKGDSVKN